MSYFNDGPSFFAFCILILIVVGWALIKDGEI
jgi:hypothetical protein